MERTEWLRALDRSFEKRETVRGSLSMYWVPDKTGRFQRRPHYSQGELDAECEQIISTFLLSRHRKIAYPIATDDLIHLLEKVAVVDQYADLKDESGNELWGVTEFVP